MLSDSPIAAVDIGGTKIAVGVVSREGRILAQAACPTSPEAGFSAAVLRACDLLRGCIAETGGRPAGVGIGCTGPVDPFSGVLGEVNLLPGWQGCDLTAAFSAELGLPAAVENDADATTLGEAAFGAGRGAASFLLVAVGTGIGGGLVLGGRLYRGTGGAHPEIGHMVVEPGGLPCTCGAQGCWESYAAGPALEDWFNRAHPQPEPWDARRICAAADAGDLRARAAVEREGRYLGLGIANLVTAFCPDTLGLAGGLMERWDLFEGEVRAALRRNCRLVPYEQVRLARAELGSRAGLLGAAQVWWSRMG